MLSKCRVCDGTLRQLYIMRNYPLTAGQVTVEKCDIPTGDLTLGYCGKCGNSSLLNTNVDNLEYGGDYTSSNIAYGYSRGMDRLTNAFLDFVGTTQKSTGSKVLEIGCYDGSFMSLMRNRYGYEVIGCEPCEEIAKVAQGKGFHVDVANYAGGRYRDLDMAIARNVLEHIPYPLEFVRNISESLKPDGVLVAEIPNGEYCIEHGILGTIVPEHPVYYSNRGVHRVLSKYMGSVSVYASGSVLRIMAKKSSPRSRDSFVDCDYTLLEEGIMKRQTRYKLLSDNVAGKEIGVYGANTCALELLAMGAIKPEQITAVYDDDPCRWGKYLVNTGLKVVEREFLKRQKCTDVVICSYTHRNILASYVSATKCNPIMLYDEGE